LPPLFRSFPLLNRSLGAEEVSALYAKYGFFLRRRCGAILRDDALADDALQEAFVKVMRSGAAIRDASEPLRWLYRVVDRCCYDALRKRRRSREASTESLGEDDMAGPHPGAAIESRDAVLQLLGTFDENAMRIALLFFMDGLSQGEIADEVGLSRVTVNKKIQAIRAGVASWLDEQRRGKVGHESPT
jgi:RNA polymerase sigma factor (sigma-70 family)